MEVQVNTRTRQHVNEPHPTPPTAKLHRGSIVVSNGHLNASWCLWPKTAWERPHTSSACSPHVGVRHLSDLEVKGHVPQSEVSQATNNKSGIYDKQTCVSSSAAVRRSWGVCGLFERWRWLQLSDKRSTGSWVAGRLQVWKKYWRFTEINPPSRCRTSDILALTGPEQQLWLCDFPPFISQSVFSRPLFVLDTRGQEMISTGDKSVHISVRCVILVLNTSVHRIVKLHHVQLLRKFHSL